MELYVITANDHLYEERVGSVIWQDETRIQLDLGNDRVLLDKDEVERIL